MTQRLPIHLCFNCLADLAVQVEVGSEQGTQRDPWRVKIDLCPVCKKALLEGDFATLASRYTTQRTITVSPQGGD